jgi:hypothetical protein
VDAPDELGNIDEDAPNQCPMDIANCAEQFDLLK